MPAIARLATPAMSADAMGNSWWELSTADALSALPCANRGCLRVSGCRERDERGKLCSGCKAARFCCRECQVAAWPGHKRWCKLQEEAAAAGGGGAAAAMLAEAAAAQLADPTLRATDSELAAMAQAAPDRQL
jgi:hypothetical protein